MNPRSVTTLIFLSLAVVTLTGCATSTLWEEGRFSRIHEPGTPPNLRLFLSRNGGNILIQYDDWTDGKDHPTMRTYWQSLNQPFRNPYRPRFVSGDESRGLIQIQTYASEPEHSDANTNLFAVAEKNPAGFILHRPDHDPLRYDLPVFEDSSGRTKQVLLTPLAVTADASIVAGYLFLLYWSGCGAGNGNYSH